MGAVAECASGQRSVHRVNTHSSSAYGEVTLCLLKPPTDKGTLAKTHQTVDVAAHVAAAVPVRRGRSYRARRRKVDGDRR